MYILQQQNRKLSEKDKKISGASLATEGQQRILVEIFCNISHQKHDMTRRSEIPNPNPTYGTMVLHLSQMGESDIGFITCLT